RTVLLPPGKWYDFYTGAYVGEKEAIAISPELSRIPLYVRDGGIIPMTTAQRQMPVPGEIIPLVVRHYGRKEGVFQLYDDNGVDFNYEQGERSWTTLLVERAENKLKGSHKTDNKEAFFYEKKVEWKFMTGK
ncbi:MAG: DUF5110 domain-containing protein, partial [Cyclobacteriaceae bacterium]|nr:DUF5110 domain-containing protein [Cyclobacteriaceae bacterium]